MEYVFVGEYVTGRRKRVGP